MNNTTPQQNTEGWEKEFDKRFRNIAFIPGLTRGWIGGEKHIKDFIRSLLLTARREEREEMREMLMRDIRIGNLDLSDPRSWEKGYNDCLVKVLSALSPNTPQE